VSPAKKTSRNNPTAIAEDALRLPPQAVELEKAILGAIMLDSEAMWRVVNVIDQNSFYREEHRKIFAAMLSLFKKQEPYDLLTVTEELKKNKQLDRVGGAHYLAELMATVPTAAHAEYHARIILEKSLLRQLISISSEIVGECYEPSCEAEDVLERMQSQIFQLSSRRERRGFLPIKPVLSDTFEVIENYHKQKGIVTGISTGFFDLDEKTSGFQDADLIIVAARPGMGKTALCLNFARNAAVEQKLPIGVFSLEMTSQQLAMRLLCSEARVNAHLVRTGRLPNPEWQKLAMSVGKLAGAPLFIDDSPGLGIMDIRTRARRVKSEHNVGMIIIDYLQLMELPKGSESQQQGIATISRSLKALAKELNIPVIAISQLSRAVEVRGGERRPQLSDLRDSGAIEQDADLVMFIYRPEYYNIKQIEDDKGETRPAEGLAEIIIGKNRNGPPGKLLLQFEKKYVRFQPLSRFREEPEAYSEHVEETGSADTPF
jgi:replicative DNA helicase